MKATLITIWTAICVAGVGFLVWRLPRPTTYQGTDVTVQVTDEKTVTIDAEVVQMEAADDTFFVLRNGGDTLVGKPTEKPLGWEEDAYFIAELDEAPGGKWLVEKGDWVTVRVVSETPVTVQVAYVPLAKIILTTFIVVVAGLLWLIIAVTISGYKD